MTQARRILVVDDQSDIRSLTTSVLQGAGYDVVGAGSGDEALEVLLAAPVDLVLLDVNMPAMDGWETLRLIRADEELAAMSVVMFTIRGEFRDQVQAMQEGALGYITKPFAINELLDRVERFLDLGGAAASSPPAQAT